MERASVGCAVTEEHDRDRAGLLITSRQRCADREAEAAANDTVRAQHTNTEIRDMLRAALSLAGTGGLAVKLRHHRIKLSTLCNGVSMAEMRTFNVILAFKACTNAGRNRFLANINMHIAQYFTGLAGTLCLKIEFTDLDHSFVMLKKLFSGKHSPSSESNFVYIIVFF